MSVPTSICFGESLIDEYPDRRVVAGAPLHVAIHMARAGWHALLWSRVGADSDGGQIRSVLVDHGVDTALLQTDDSASTGTVAIEFPDELEHQFTIRFPAAWDHIEAMEPLPDHDVFYYGTLAARHATSAHTLWHALQASPARFRVFDVNLRAPYDDIDTALRGLGHATLVKMNSDEVSVICRAVGLSLSPGDLLRSYHGIDYLCVTRGDEGAELHVRDQGVAFIESADVDPVDTVGAGDAFTAGLVVALVDGATAEQALALANQRVASVLRVRGGLPPLR